MLAQIWSAALLGLEAYPVRVEVDVGPGLAGFSTVGLPDPAIRESRERVISALRNSGFEFPLRRVVVNLSPADRRKEGSAFDLPIALGILVASRQLDFDAVAGLLVLGELSLEGHLRPLRGALALAGACARGAPCRMLLPRGSAREAALQGGAIAFGASSLREAVAMVRGERSIVPAAPLDAGPGEAVPLDLASVRGQRHARRALEIAAAGGHNILLTGPPGAGKTMLAHALPGILSPLEHEEALEVLSLHSIAGLADPGRGLPVTRPFRAPHHTVSAAGLAGGGRPVGPGEISLAHRGVLFLDEITEFPPRTLEILRQPLEEAHIAIARAGVRVRFPARFLLAASRNPCRCGMHGVDGRTCRCTPGEKSRYAASLSGPILDRFDLDVGVPPVPLVDLLRAGARSECSAAVRARVVRARGIQRLRWQPLGFRTNAEAPPETLLEAGRVDPAALDLAGRFAETFKLSARGFHRLLRVARTVGDLSEAGRISMDHVAEAAAFRNARAVDEAGAPS